MQERDRKPESHGFEDVPVKEKIDSYRVNEEDVTLEQRQMESRIMYFFPHTSHFENHFTDTFPGVKSTGD